MTHRTSLFRYISEMAISQATRTAGGRAADSDSRHTSLLHLCMISLTSEISYARHDTTYKCVGGRGTL
jgi:hypothetical protein